MNKTTFIIFFLNYLLILFSSLISNSMSQVAYFISLLCLDFRIFEIILGKNREHGEQATNFFDLYSNSRFRFKAQRTYIWNETTSTHPTV